MLEIAWYWNQSLVNIKLIGASVAASTGRHNIPAIIIAVYFFEHEHRPNSICHFGDSLWQNIYLRFLPLLASQ